MTKSLKIKNTEVKIIKGDITKLMAGLIFNPLENNSSGEATVRDACRNALKKAQKLKARMAVFTALGWRRGTLGVLACAKLMAQEVFRHLKENNSTLREIVFCLNDREEYLAFRKNVYGYLDYITNRLRSPFVTVDAIIETGKDSIVIIKRSNPPFGWALPGGFLDYGESLEEAVVREAKEETGLKLMNVKQFHTYSDPKRDPRFHTVGTVFIAKARGKPRAGDDAAGARIIKLNEIKDLDFAFDHEKIIKDYINYKRSKKKY